MRCVTLGLCVVVDLYVCGFHVRIDTGCGWL